MKIKINNLTIRLSNKTKINLDNFIKDIRKEFKNIRFQRPVELDVIFCNKEFIKKLNKRYRKKNKATDVLSFPIEKDLKEIFKKTKIPLLLGNIVICPEAARDSLIYLFSHGFLHLLGWRHK